MNLGNKKKVLGDSLQPFKVQTQFSKFQLFLNFSLCEFSFSIG